MGLAMTSSASFGSASSSSSCSLSSVFAFALRAARLRWASASCFRKASFSASSTETRCVVGIRALVNSSRSCVTLLFCKQLCRLDQYYNHQASSGNVKHHRIVVKCSQPLQVAHRNIHVVALRACLQELIIFVWDHIQLSLQQYIQHMYIATNLCKHDCMQQVDTYLEVRPQGTIPVCSIGVPSSCTPTHEVHQQPPPVWSFLQARMRAAGEKRKTG